MRDLRLVNRPNVIPYSTLLRKYSLEYFHAAKMNPLLALLILTGSLYHLAFGFADRSTTSYPTYGLEGREETIEGLATRFVITLKKDSPISMEVILPHQGADVELYLKAHEALKEGLQAIPSLRLVNYTLQEYSSQEARLEAYQDQLREMLILAEAPTLPSTNFSPSYVTFVYTERLTTPDSIIIYTARVFVTLADIQQYRNSHPDFDMATANFAKIRRALAA